MMNAIDIHVLPSAYGEVAFIDAALADALAKALDEMSNAEEWLARADPARERVVMHSSLKRCFDDMMHKHQKDCE